MEVAAGIVALVAVVLIVSALSDRFGVASPLALVTVGIGASFIPDLPQVPLHPDLVLLGLLPPLLYAASFRSSLIDFRTNLQPIGMLSVVLVIFTAVCVGLVTTALLDVPFAVGLALGAIVGPPDAVAATAVGRRIGLPRKVTTLLEGESLWNDATSIVLLRTAIAAIAGTVGVWQAVGSFALSAFGGIAIGLIAAVLLRFALRHLSDPILTTGVSFISPWVAYLPAEHIHSSGVVAVVVTGLIVGHRAPVEQTAVGRMSARINWNTVQFLLENSVFLLIGLQMRTIFHDASASSLGWPRIALICAAVMATVIVARIVFCAPAAVVATRSTHAESRLSWREMTALSWAGMRGVVTLAAAFILPADVPHREVLVFAAMVVVAGSLLVQGSTLPALSRALHLQGPTARTDAFQQAVVMRAALKAGLQRLDTMEQSSACTIGPDTFDELRSRAAGLLRANWEQLGPNGRDGPQAQARRARLQMLQAERDEVLRLRDSGQGDHEVLQQVLFILDAEEAALTAAQLRGERVAVAELLTMSHTGECDHLRVSREFDDPEPLSTGCLECAEEGLTPVGLRMCLTCGYVGCCESSEGRHAMAHFEQRNHPVIRVFADGERWRWCYIDEIRN